MLISLSLHNFRTFKGDHTFYMTKGTTQSRSERVISARGHGVLPSAVIYGANGSGKSNLLLGHNFLRFAIVHGTLREFPTPITVIPNEFWLGQKEFGITSEFVVAENCYKYELAVSASNLSEIEIISEALYVATNKSFPERYDNVFVRTAKHLVFNSTGNKWVNAKIAQEGVSLAKTFVGKDSNSATTFISSDIFESIFEFAEAIQQWFRVNFLVFSSDSVPQFSIKVNKETNESEAKLLTEYIESIFSTGGLEESLFEVADIGPQKVFTEYEIRNEDSYNIVVPVKKTKYNDRIFDAEHLESKGTLQLLELFPQLFISILEGMTLIIDELDNSLHPDLVFTLIDLFNDPEINTTKSQLIFTSHNPIYINRGLFRKDQIFFVEKDSSTLSSSIYSLDDFKTNDESKTRNDTAWLNAYLKGKYGGIPEMKDLNSFVRNLKEEWLIADE